MENKLIQITDKILGVIVPSDAYDFEFIHDKIRIGYKVDYRLFKIDLPKGEFKIHGTCTLPAFDFDFEPIMGKEELTDLIQKAIQDEGMYTVNPYENPMQNSDNGFYGFNTRTGDKIMKWQSAESKTVKKLLLIEKI